MVVDQNRSRYNGRNRGHSHGSSDCRVLKDINQGKFHSGDGILPTPVTPGKMCKTPIGKPGTRFLSSSGFNKTPLAEGKSSNRKSRGSSLKKSSAVPFSNKVGPDKENFPYCKKLSYSEHWAGPAYSNSPPPSSLPIPRFSVPPKPSASLELFRAESEIHLQPTSRSAPPSPKREHGISTRNGFRGAYHACATKDLRRILNLDLMDE